MKLLHLFIAEGFRISALVNKEPLRTKTGMRSSPCFTNELMLSRLGATSKSILATDLGSTYPTIPHSFNTFNTTLD